MDLDLCIIFIGIGFSSEGTHCNHNKVKWVLCWDYVLLDR